MKTKGNWGFDDPYENCEYLKNIRNRFEQLKEVTDDMLYEILNAAVNKEFNKFPSFFSGRGKSFYA